MQHARPPAVPDLPSWRAIAALLLLILVCAARASAAETGDRLTFNRDIRPILAEHCFTCHGQDKAARKSDLRLDDRASALTGGKSGDAAIIPGRPEASILIKRVLTTDPDDIMPPPKAKNPLKPAEIEALRLWITQGADYQPHWAYIPPQQKPLPAEARGHAIDALVAAQLARAGLKPAPQADPQTLCRRLWLDLVGLPPGPQELDAFASSWAHGSEAAYIAQVDQLLASPRYGERWARPWLDIARYADSDGYEKDLPRQQWAWRDWVIRLLNADLPYDRFIIEQVAGDMLPDAAKDQIVATGYLRNAMVSEEGAIIAEQYRMEGMFDRMDALGKGVLGLTVQCAQCHSHKFDPITQDDYYRMFAALNDTYEATSRVYGPEKLKTIASIHHGIAEIAAGVKREHADWQSRFAAWQDGLQSAGIPWEVIAPIDPVWSGGLVHPQVLVDGSVLSLGFRGNNGELSFTCDAQDLDHHRLPLGGADPSRPDLRRTWSQHRRAVRGSRTQDRNATARRGRLDADRADLGHGGFRIA